MARSCSCRRRRRHDALDQRGGGVAEDAGGIAVVVAVDFAAGGIGGVAADAGELEGKRIGEGHVAVDALEEGGMAVAGGVDELAIGQDGRIPALMVPGAAANPGAGGEGFGVAGDAVAEIGLAGGVAELDGDEGSAAGQEVNVSIIESGQKQAAGEVDGAGAGAGELADLRVAADGEDGVAVEGHGLRHGLRRIHRPNLAIYRGSRLPPLPRHSSRRSA